MWELFRKYHYLNSELHRGAKCFIALINNRPVGFIAVLHFPHSKVKNIKRVHRLVVLPDYQGIGIGSKLLEFIGRKYILDNWQFRIVTSTPALISHFRDSKFWRLVNFGRNRQHSGLKPFGSNGRLTCSFKMKLP